MSEPKQASQHSSSTATCTTSRHQKGEMYTSTRSTRAFWYQEKFNPSLLPPLRPRQMPLLLWPTEADRGDGVVALIAQTTHRIWQSGDGKSLRGAPDCCRSSQTDLSDHACSLLLMTTSASRVASTQTDWRAPAGRQWREKARWGRIGSQPAPPARRRGDRRSHSPAARPTRLVQASGVG